MNKHKQMRRAKIEGNAKLCVVALREVGKSTWEWHSFACVQHGYVYFMNNKYPTSKIAKYLAVCVCVCVFMCFCHHSFDEGTAQIIKDALRH